MAEMKLVRIKPYNSRKGFLARNHTHRGKVFQSEMGWYKVPASLAAELAEKGQPQDDAIPMFDVCDLEGARKIDESEAEKDKAAMSEKAHVVDVSFLRGAKELEPPPTPEKAAAPEPSLESEEPEKALEEMTKAELAAHAEAMGVEIERSWKRDMILSAIKYHS